ncbi:hypothetical protein [Nocardia nepalensis]|uniref:hypothetical protein n=1 Tax=Nocardia nepalensis TaxID=3375448 RepID=UPI003B674446
MNSTTDESAKDTQQPGHSRAASETLTPTLRQPISGRDAALAAALHEVFSATAHGPDSIELWLDIAQEATQQLTAPQPDSASAVPIFAIYRNERTDAVFDPDTTTVHVVSGPLTGTQYRTPSEAAQAIVAHAIGDDRQCVVPGWTTWRLHDGHQLALSRHHPNSPST